ncbi:MAG: ABC transporter substrate-binding protein [Chelatococcus sp.]|uniref:ABC transporter substrate-binding protein n=1 Tax=Chelatococcus sp. TaxID=1953771 RepID=UPI0025BDB11D|nr:ABC transporter substrate-binding protein [Chelatococcus sp.]MBX3538793.1 ABC transporter substrate-binding protein [Chelatococcus sp.]
MRKTGITTVLRAAAFAVVASLPAASWAADLKIGFSAPATTLDPQFHNASQNIAVSRNMFDTLVQMDPDSQIVPALAESWRLVDDTTWEFKLRPAKFSDGSAVTAEDVVWSLDRPATIPNSPSSFTIYTRPVVEKKIIDEQTVQLKTAAPYPLLLADLTNVFIVSKKATEGLTSDKFVTGQGVVGSGPYKFKSYTPDDRVIMTANENYWGDKPAWDTVEIRFLPNDSSRLSALLSGEVDAIENIPTPDLEAVKNNKNLVVGEKMSHRLIFLFLDSGRDETPGVSAADGSPLKANPFKDVRVRKAVNLAIDREAIASRLMQGLAFPTNNIVTETMQGYVPGIKPSYDPEQAKKLLAEAGYDKGFRLVLASPNNRLINDAKVAQALAQMLTRVGIRTSVDAVPFAVINTRGNKGEFSSVMMGWGAQTAEASSPIRAMIACTNKEKGWGPVNWGNYCNPNLDAVTAKALNTMDDAARSKLLQDATQIVHDDVAIVPLYFQANTWAAKPGITITPRMDERTSALMFTPAK